jgi:HupE / UreJ protein
VSELLAFAQLGFRHIVDLSAMDHLLFLVALAAIYRFRDARQLVWVVTAFTIGHSVTLALAVTGILVLPEAIVEFLIPVTIVATGVENLLVPDHLRSTRARWHRPLIAGLFGLVHGAGFANYLRALFVDRIAAPLLGFNLGIEAGQLLVLATIVALFWLVDTLITGVRRPTVGWTTLRLRTVAVSAVVIVMGSMWAVERRPW